MNRRFAWPLGAIVLLALAAAGCAVNPATGKHEISLVTPEQEAALGREGYAAATAEYGVYDDPALAAYVDSVVGTFFPQIFTASFRSMDGAAPVYFEAAAVITTLVLLGQVLELRASQRTSGAIRPRRVRSPAPVRPSTGPGHLQRFAALLH